MLSVKGNQSDLESVLMPSECLQKYRTYPRVRRDTSAIGLFWAIEYTDATRRIAHLVRESELDKYKRPGIKSIIPAYKKG